ncbi:MAG TPA: hypothetical protein VFI22_18340 [Thermomicrobiales bacterium]|nr:hypothetical protein [Thermomicrobiales bacterium]
MTVFALRIGRIKGYSVIIGADRIAITTPDGRGLIHDVPNYGTSIGELAARRGFKLGWAVFPDDAEVLYFYDSRDSGFGYAVNVDAPQCSEWGYAPFGPFDQPAQDAEPEPEPMNDLRSRAVAAARARADRDRHWADSLHALATTRRRQGDADTADWFEREADAHYAAAGRHGGDADAWETGARPLPLSEEATGAVG